jgi:two-component system chemotaxis sensor kinase CheA
MDDPFAQFKDTYINECYELLTDMEDKLLGLDESADAETLNAIFRCAHSIKGGAGAFGFDAIAAFTHILEALLDRMREGEIAATAEVVDCLLRARDIVQTMVQAAQTNQPLDEHFGNDVAAELQSFSPDIGAPATAKPTEAAPAPSSSGETCYHITFQPKPALIGYGNEPLLLLKELSELGTLKGEATVARLPALDKMELDDCYIDWSLTLTSTCTKDDILEVFEFVQDECILKVTAETTEQEPTEAPSQPQEGAPENVNDAGAAAAPKPAVSPKTQETAAVASAPQVTSIRVDIDKIDRLINMVGEVVITQAYLSSQVRGFSRAQYGDLLDGVDQISQHIRELQESVMSVRMQPVKSIFSRMPRLVRDLCGQLGKDIELEMVGEQTEVDKTIIEQLSDPLTHMIRNSVDHGVEMPEAREAAGKPRQGTIRLAAEHCGGRIEISISDDGGGINRERVYAKAVEKGVIAADAQLSDHDIDMLIFAPGFSTAAQVSNVSGRGVGMDVVRRNIEGLGGTVDVENTPGQGSCFTISLPLTLAILDGMIVRCGSENYIIPINNIVETLRPKSGDVRPLASGGAVINVRGEFIPIMYLYQLFNISNAQPDASKALVVLIENGKEQFGIVVDELVGQQQVVIKSLEDNSDRIEGVSGATILGDGRVSLILDMGALVRMSKRDKHFANDNGNREHQDAI